MTASVVTRVGVDDYYSAAVLHGGVAYLAGVVADDGSTTIALQTADVLRQIDAQLADLRTDKSRLLTATVWLADLGDYDAFNEVWRGWVASCAPPARATGQVALSGPQYLVEIIATVAL